MFSECISHDEATSRAAGKPTSAGFVTLVPITKDGEGYINATVYGESTSLGIGSNGDHDNMLIELAINTNTL